MGDASRIAARWLDSLGRRWRHVQTAGRLADELVSAVDLPDEVAAAAWLHDVGYAPPLAVSGFHPLDGARYLLTEGAPLTVVGLVAHHTGAAFEAEERGLSAELAALPVPDPGLLDTVTLIDLVSAPDGGLTTPERRVDEILERYTPDDVVHRAVTRSRPELLASAARARAALGLSDEWPLGLAEGVGDSHPH